MTVIIRVVILQKCRLYRADTRGITEGHTEGRVGTDTDTDRQNRDTPTPTPTFRRESLNEAHDSTFGILQNYLYCRFYDSSVIAALQIIGLIFFCTGMHHEYFLRSSMCFRVPHLCSKIPKIYNWSLDNGEHSVCFRGDFAIKTVVGFLR